MDKYFLQISTDSLTQRFSGKASQWIVSFGPRLLLAILFFFIGQWIIKILARAFQKILTSRHVNDTLRPFIQNLFQILLQVLLVLGIMQLLGIQMTLFAALVGAFGVAAGLALSGTLQNFASGVLIILLRPFKVGDNIKTQGEEGTVTSIRLFYSVILTFNNVTLIVPNSKLSNEVIFNLTREKTRRLDIEIKFKSAVNFSDVEKIMQEAIADAGVYLPTPQARIGIEAVDADSYTVGLNVWVNAHGYQDARLALNRKLMEELKKMGSIS